MKFILDISTDSKDEKIKEKCLSAVAGVLITDGAYFGVSYSVEDSKKEEQKELHREVFMPTLEQIRSVYAASKTLANLSEHTNADNLLELWLALKKYFVKFNNQE